VWPEQFESVVRPHLPYLPADRRLTPDTRMSDLGLDSIGVVELLAALETKYAVHFSDDVLTMATFATPATLWRALSTIRADAI
jgi:acyl carrier protein